MKKLLFMAVVALALVLTMAVVASANGGPHGGYTATTDACAGCHRAHTATNANLLMDTTYNLCWSCHSNAGVGADTNVQDGYFLSTRSTSVEGQTLTADNAPLLAGGFANHGVGNVVISQHEPAAGTLQAWGAGVAGVRGVLSNLAGAPDPLTCASCHDPHGSTNYRIIPTTVNGVGVAVAQVDEGAATKDYDDENWSGVGMNDFCAACHSAYHVTQADAGSIAAGAKIAAQYGNDTSTWAHRVGMLWNESGKSGISNPETAGFDDDGAGPNPPVYLPLSDNTTVICTTCHLPHGSSATMTAGGPADGAGVPGETSATENALLRLDNRGVCEVCHQK
jgi:predicted CXXCH cytochrome family protein